MAEAATKPNIITLPAMGWQPREYQMPAWQALENGMKRALLAWHRRAGKDDFCLHWTATQMVQRVGTYWYMLPEANQARKAIWDAVNPNTGFRRVDEAFPKELRYTTRDQDMMVKMKHPTRPNEPGSTWQVVGSDNFNSLMGSPPIGVVFSEFALANPSSWAYISPILEENGGWALFNSTVRGANHYKDFFDAHGNDPDWYSEILSARDTSVFDETQLNRIRKDLRAEYGATMGEALFRQEYLSDWNAGVPGAYYADEMTQAAEEGRITGDIAIDNGRQVHTAWDIGMGDDTAIWFFTLQGDTINLVDFYHNSGARIDHYINVLREKNYHYGQHFFPHDFFAQRGEVETREETLRNHGIEPEHLGNDKMSVEDGIARVRQIFPRCRFHAERCQHGINSLQQYRRIWDDKKKKYQDRPYHDWASDASDSFRYVAIAVTEGLPKDAGSSYSTRKLKRATNTQWIV